MDEGATRHFKPPLGACVDRVDYVLAACRGRRVLHVGAADWPVHERRAAEGALLHDRITGAARECLGIDYDAEAVRWLAERGRENLRVADAERLEDLDEAPFELIVAGEVLEHLPNPGRFLAGAHHVLGEQGSLLLTAPNAFWFRGIVHSLFRQESVHPDHNYYFSPTTLTTLLRKTGWAVNEIRPYAADGARGSWKAKVLGGVESLARRASPFYADGWVALATPIAAGR